MFANSKSLFFLQFSIKNRSSHELAKKVIRLKLEAHFDLKLQSFTSPHKSNYQSSGKRRSNRSRHKGTSSSHKGNRSSRSKRSMYSIEKSSHKKRYGVKQYHQDGEMSREPKRKLFTSSTKKPGDIHLRDQIIQETDRENYDTNSNIQYKNDYSSCKEDEIGMLQLVDKNPFQNEGRELPETPTPGLIEFDKQITREKQIELRQKKYRENRLNKRKQMSQERPGSYQNHRSNMRQFDQLPDRHQDPRQIDELNRKQTEVRKIFDLAEDSQTELKERKRKINNFVSEQRDEDKLDLEEDEFRFVETGLSRILNSQTHRGLLSSTKKSKPDYDFNAELEKASAKMIQERSDKKKKEAENRQRIHIPAQQIYQNVLESPESNIFSSKKKNPLKIQTSKSAFRQDQYPHKVPTRKSNEHNRLSELDNKITLLQNSIAKLDSYNSGNITKDSNLTSFASKNSIIRRSGKKNNTTTSSIEEPSINMIQPNKYPKKSHLKTSNTKQHSGYKSSSKKYSGSKERRALYHDVSVVHTTQGAHLRKNLNKNLSYSRQHNMQLNRSRDSQSFFTPYRGNNTKNSVILNKSLDSNFSKNSKGRSSISNRRGRSRRLRNHSKEANYSQISYNYRADDADIKFLQEMRNVTGMVLLKLFINVSQFVNPFFEF